MCACSSPHSATAPVLTVWHYWPSVGHTMHCPTYLDEYCHSVSSEGFSRQSSGFRSAAGGGVQEGRVQAGGAGVWPHHTAAARAGADDLVGRQVKQPSAAASYSNHWDTQPYWRLHIAAALSSS